MLHYSWEHPKEKSAIVYTTPLQQSKTPPLPEAASFNSTWFLRLSFYIQENVMQERILLKKFQHKSDVAI
jgi:hypothetical protein